jgi:triosephosphate isomerase (TIM)
MARTPLIVGNWKMYKTIPEAVEFVETLAPLVADSQAEVYLAVPYTAIAPAVEAAAGSNIVIGAQNMNDSTEGAFTGEIAARMLVDAGAKFVVLGHSERRHVFGETDAFVNAKVKRAIADGLRPIVCVGETFEQREAGETNEVLQMQLEGSLAGIEELGDLVVAYEPVWAIGTGHSATPKQAQKEHALLRKLVGKQTLLYGGSVNPENAAVLMAQPDIDGVLVGGASLSEISFSKIVKG